MEVLISVATILFFGTIFGKLIKLFKLPEVTGYLLSGLLIGPYILNLVSLDDIYILEPLTIIALTFISFLVGAELKWKYVKKLGSKPFVIGLITSLCALFLVTIGCILLGYDYKVSLLLGAIATSAAPSSVLMIVKEYQARGELTKTMLSVIAISDILSVVLFGICLALVKENTSIVLSLLEPLKEIIFSLLVGGILGYTIGYLSRYLQKHGDIITLIIIAIFVNILFCDLIGISQLLSAMIMGITFINSFNSHITDKVLDVIDDISTPLLIIFFVLSTASLDFNTLPSIWLIGLVYIILRIVGKIIGNFIGSKITKESKNITKYLGLTLLSQTGIAIGLATLAANIIDNGELLIAVVLASSFIYDIICPLLVKYVLKKVQEI